AAKELRKDPQLERLARTTSDLAKLLDRASELEEGLQRLETDVAAAAPDPTGRFSLDREKRLLDAFQRERRILESSKGLLARFASRRSAADERLKAARLLSETVLGSGPAGSPR